MEADVVFTTKLRTKKHKIPWIIPPLERITAFSSWRCASTAIRTQCSSENDLHQREAVYGCVDYNTQNSGVHAGKPSRSFLKIVSGAQWWNTSSVWLWSAAEEGTLSESNIFVSSHSIKMFPKSFLEIAISCFFCTFFCCGIAFVRYPP